MQNLFNKENADLVILLKKMQNFDRYGTVQIDANHRILAFTEKKIQEEAWINSGVYLLNTEHFLLHAPQKENFSFETEFLETHTTNLKFYASQQKGYFIDIGIPEDYLKSQEDFSYLAPE
jgi:D-glycero-alpha-D-manno-heptose 1-phosphate guanylyltransferase